MNLGSSTELEIYESFNSNELKLKSNFWITKSSNEKKKRCIYIALNPLFLIGRIFAIFSYCHDKKNCRVYHTWYSPLPWLNIAWVIGDIIFSTAIFPSVFNALSTSFHIKNFYTYLLSIMVRVCGTFVIYLYGNYNSIILAKAWEKLHILTEELPFHKFKNLKYIVHGLILYLVQPLVMSIFMVFYYFHKHDLRVAGLSLPLVMPLGTFFTSFIPDLLSGTYIVFLWIIATSFNAINDHLADILVQNTLMNRIRDRHLCIELKRARRLHEDTCKIIRLLQKAFGVQLLATFIGGCVTFISGLYSFINSMQKGSQYANAIGPHGIDSLVITAIRLLAIVFSCQNVLNASQRSGNILNKFDDNLYSKEVKTQIDKFVRKIGNSPVRTTCCEVFEIGNSFLASGTSNVVTYILILLQFK